MSVIPGVRWGGQCAGYVCLAGAEQAIRCVSDRAARQGESPWRRRRGNNFSGRGQRQWVTASFITAAVAGLGSAGRDRRDSSRSSMAGVVQERSRIQSAVAVKFACLFFEILSSPLLIRPHFIPWPAAGEVLAHPKAMDCVQGGISPAKPFPSTVCYVSITDEE